MLKFTTGMVIMRLIWFLHNNKDETFKQRIRECKVLYGTVDTWLIWKLTKGSVHATEPSNACTSGFYDPFKMEWGKWALNMVGIPESILPEVKDTNGFFGNTDPELFGTVIPIRSVMGDQQAATFGECCFAVGDIKCTLGTGKVYRF